MSLPSRYGCLFAVAVHPKTKAGMAIVNMVNLALCANGVFFAAHAHLAIHRTAIATAATIAIVRMVRRASASIWLP